MVSFVVAFVPVFSVVALHDENDAHRQTDNVPRNEISAFDRAGQTLGDNMMRNFEDVLRELEEARSLDDGMHSQCASLLERVASRERLTTLRAELAEIRRSRGLDDTMVAGLHDSRTRRGTDATRNAAT